MPSSINDAPLRYAVLRHAEVPEPHFDFLIETAPGSDLATWRCESWPIESSVTLTRLKDHRKIFLTYEGDLTGHRGAVQRIDDGICSLMIDAQNIWTITFPNSLSITMEKLTGDQWRATNQ